MELACRYGVTDKVDLQARIVEQLLEHQEWSANRPTRQPGRRRHGALNAKAFDVRKEPFRNHVSPELPPAWRLFFISGS